MPPWLYLRGILMMLLTGSRPTFLLGHTHSHGVPYYFPVVFALKSTLGFLVLLILAAAAAILLRKRGVQAVPDQVRPHWRVLMVGFFVYLAVCLLSLMDISIRHFMVPIALLILMLAPLPRMVRALPGRKLWQTAIVVAVASSFAAIALAYPYFLPFVNSLAFGHPAYQLMNDSNVSWNDALPEVERFTRERHLEKIALDWASLADPTLVVPQAEAWDCQDPANRDGQWVAVAAVSLLENHNCGYLQQYPHQQLAGGSYYVFQLPAPIPQAGQPGGPPPVSARRIMWGMPFDLRAVAVNMERHPERMAEESRKLMQKFQDQSAHRKQ
jgi:amino acid transporter